MVIGIDASRAFIAERTGTENYSYHLISAILRLPAASKHTFVLFIRPNAVVPDELVGYDNVIVKVIPLRYLWTQVGLAYATWRQYGSDGSLAEGKVTIKTAKLQNRTTAKRNLDVLWVPAHTLPVLRNPKVKTVVTIHGLEYRWLREYNNFLQRWYLPLSTIYATRDADKLIAVSKFTAKQLEKELHTNSKKIKVVYEGVKQDSRFQKIEASRTLDRYGLQEKKFVLFVGTIQPRKNLVALIEAFSQLRFQLRGDSSQIKLVIAGGVGWLAEAVFRAPARYGVQERVIFTGRVDDAELAMLYRGAVLYVQPSVTEGFGLPILEAMGQRVPVIGSDGGALPEVLGKAGITVKLGKNFVSELASAMKRVIADEKRQKNLITKGYKRAKEFTWQKTAKATLNVILG